MTPTKTLLSPLVEYNCNFILHGSKGSQAFKNVSTPKVHKYVCEFFNVQSGSIEERLVNTAVTFKPLIACIHSSNFKTFCLEFEKSDGPIHKNKCYPTKEQYSEYRPLKIYDRSKESIVDKLACSLNVLFPHCKNSENLSVVPYKESAVFVHVDNLSEQDKEKMINSDLGCLSHLEKKSLGFMTSENILELSKLPIKNKLSLLYSLYDPKMYKATTLIMINKNSRFAPHYSGIMHNYFAKKE